MAVRTMLTLDDISKSFDKSNYNFGTDLSTKHFHIKCALEFNFVSVEHKIFDCNIEFDYTPNISGAYPYMLLTDHDASGKYFNGVILFFPLGTSGGTYSNISGTLNGNAINESFFNGTVNVIQYNDYAFSKYDWDFTVGGQPIDTSLPLVIQGQGGIIFPQSWTTTYNFLQYFDNYDSPSESYWKYYNHQNLLQESNPILNRLINLTDKPAEMPVGYDYYIYNKYRTCDVDAFGNVSNYGPIQVKYERIRMTGTGRCSLYLNEADNSLTIKYSGEVYSSSYKEAVAAPYNDVEGSIQSLGPFYYKLGNQIGTGIKSCTMLQTNMRIWKNEEDANKDANGEDPTGEDEDGNITIPTPPEGDDDETEFGSSDARSPFGKVYSMTLSHLLNITNIFYSNDESIIANIKKGLELYGANPIQSIISLMYFPFSEEQIGTWTSENKISFGSYTHDLDFSIKKLAAPSGFLSGGTFTIARYFNDWRDYEPYSSITIYLPYVGLKKLDLARYLGKTVSIRYYVDIYTGSGICCLMSNGQMIEYFDCVLGVNLPIQGSDFASYSSSMLQSVMNSGSSVFSGAGAGAKLGSMIGGVGAPVGAMAGGVAGAVGSGFSLSQMSKPNDLLTTKGSFSGGVALNMPQYIYLIYEYYETETPNNLHKIYGLPSNYGGYGREFSGFTKGRFSELKTDRMTSNEVNELESLIQSGIYL